MFDYIERFYSTAHRHPTIGCVSPAQFEKGRISITERPRKRQQATSVGQPKALRDCLEPSIECGAVNLKLN
ncbi:hypothetical protein CHELA1G2_14304 [Hyphomicrobiales bacterium]|nr:hypothetical protein CHELA1G2_14304 [Hyphomicrobiales bacterium]